MSTKTGSSGSPKGRVAELDHLVSKHLLVLAEHEKDRVYFLAVHLLLPIAPQADKQAKQREAIGAWATSLLAREPGATVVVVGNTNFSERKPLYGVARDAGELNAFAATYLTNKCYAALSSLEPRNGLESRFCGHPTDQSPTTRTSAFGPTTTSWVRRL